MARHPSLVGQRFGRRVVVAEAPYRGSRRYWLCECDCGARGEADDWHLRHGQSLSCGCLTAEVTAKKELTHGGSETPEYAVWRAMRNRCYNPRTHKFAIYGARGITVCEEWRDDFAAFRRDMGPRPSARHSVERIDNDGPYAPWNCRWATAVEQGANRRDNHYLEYNGQLLTIVEWARLLGFKYSTLERRINHAHWPVGRALMTPVRGGDHLG